MAFQAAERELGAVGLSVTLRSIDAAALRAASQWRGRLVDWDWPSMAVRWRQNHTSRFELAVWRGEVLLGLAIGRPSKTAPHLSLHFVEANPDPENPLRRKMMVVVLAAMVRYAVALGKTEIRLIDPLPEVRAFYCSSDLGFELVSPASGAPYCRRSI